MTFYIAPTTINSHRVNPFKKYWLTFWERMKLTSLARPKMSSTKEKASVLNSGMPVSHDVSTNLSIRAGFTAGPW